MRTGLSFFVATMQGCFHLILFDALHSMRLVSLASSVALNYCFVQARSWRKLTDAGDLATICCSQLRLSTAGEQQIQRQVHGASTLSEEGELSRRSRRCHEPGSETWTGLVWEIPIDPVLQNRS